MSKAMNIMLADFDFALAYIDDILNNLYLMKEIGDPWKDFFEKI